MHYVVFSVFNYHVRGGEYSRVWPSIVRVWPNIMEGIMEGVAQYTGGYNRGCDPIL